MKKPKNYYGFAFDDCRDGYNKKYLKSKAGKKEIKKCKKRMKKYRKQYQKFGFDATETWNLDSTIAQFIVPRLKYFRKNLVGYPGDLTEKKWYKILDKMIFSFEVTLNNYDYFDCTKYKSKKRYKKVQKGFALFGKYFMNLWD